MEAIMITAPLLGIVQETGDAVITLLGDQDQGELLASVATRAEVAQQLSALASVMRSAPDKLVKAMPEVDWAGWAGVGVSLRFPGPAFEDALWFGAHALVPHTLARLAEYRQSRPELFRWWG
ncbi:MAG: hypothetical protein CFE46_12745 [Burkholderiales bacterium PBB6]|nr:MAG: hypothetical protein CFE46_12745 [Burkholderiales bacterium PBB6]